MLQEEESKKSLIIRSQTQLYDLVRRVNSFPLTLNNHYREWGLYGEHHGWIRQKTELEITRHLKKEVRARRRKNLNGKRQNEKVKLPLISVPSSKILQRDKSLALSEEKEQDDYLIELPLTPEWSAPTPTTTQKISGSRSAVSKRRYFSLKSSLQDRKYHLPPVPPKIDRRDFIAVYICSSGLDFEVESRAVRELVMPKLRDLCLPYQKDILLIDLLWGNEDELCNTHDMDEMMKTEYWKQMTRCMRSQHGGHELPTEDTAFSNCFVIAFLGQRYGEPPLPKELSQNTFERMMQFVQSENQKMNEMNVAELEIASPAAASSFSNFENVVNNDDASRQTIQTRVRFAEDDEESPQTVAVKSVPNLESAPSTTSLIAKREERLDMSVLKQLYEQRENVFKLKHIKSVSPDFGKADEDKSRQSRSVWITLRRRAIEFLLLYLDSSWSEDDTMLREHFSKSTFHRDLENFVLHPSIDRRKCLILHRKLFGLETHASDEGALFYLDSVNKIPSAENIFRELRETIENEIPYANQRFYRPPWKAGGVSPTNDGEHRSYISSLVNDLTEFLTENIEHSINQNPHAKTMVNSVKQKKEFSYQFLFHSIRSEKRSLWIHQQTVSQVLDEFLESPIGRNKQLLLIHGPEGIGVTTTLENWLGRQFFQHPNYLFFNMQLGLSDVTYDISSCLTQLCLEVYSKSKVESGSPQHLRLPKEPSALAWKLMHFLENVEQEVVLVMDSLDYLRDKDELAGTRWIPPKFPENVKIILSTSQQGHMNALHKQHPNLLTVECGPIHNEDLCLDRLIHLHPNVINLFPGRNIEKDKSTVKNEGEALLSYFHVNSSPLFIQLSVEIISRWDVVNVTLPTFNGTLKQIGILFFSLLERDLGEPLVRRALGYIAASRLGVGENELLDLLTCDKVVMDYANAQTRAKFSKTYFPAVHWWRLLWSIRRFLFIDLQGRLHWRFLAFHEACRERYFITRDRAPSYHLIFSDYFGNKYADKSGTQSQQLIRKTVNSNTAIKTSNIRKLQEFPYHLVNSLQHERLKRECIFHIEFSQAFLRHCGLPALSDYLDIMAGYLAEDKEIPLYKHFLDTVGELLMENPQELVSQFVSRLNQIIQQGQSTNPPQYPNMAAMLHQMTDETGNNKLLPMLPYNTTLKLSQIRPKKILFLPESDSPAMTCLALAQNSHVLAAASNATRYISIWDLREAVMLSMVDKRKAIIYEMAFFNADEQLLTSEPTCVSVWDVKEGKLLKKIIENISDPCSLAFIWNRDVVALIFPGSCKVRAFGLKDGSYATDLVFEYPDHATLRVHQDKTLLGAQESKTDKLLLALRGHNEAFVTSIPAKGEWREVFRLKCFSAGTTIEAVASTETYYIVGGNFMTSESVSRNIVCLDLFDVERGRFVRRVRGCGQDSLQHPLNIEPSGLHCITIGYSQALQKCHVAAWNLETEEHKHLVNDISLAGKAMVTFAYKNIAEFVTVEEDQESRVSVWNMAHLMKENGIKIVPKHAWTQLKLMKSPEEDIQQIVALSELNKEVTIFKTRIDFDKGKRVVSILKESNFEKYTDIFSSTDVVLDHLLLPGASDNPKAPLVVLSDCKFSHIMPDCKQVYQLVKFFDLEEGLLLNRLKDVFIIPSRQTEYHLFEEKAALAPTSGSAFDSFLSEDLSSSRSSSLFSSLYLLGLSENRSHFVCWNLNVGQAVWRMRTDFRETEHRKHQVDCLTSQRISTSSKFEAEIQLQRSLSLTNRNLNQEGKLALSSVDLLFAEEKDNTIENYLLSNDGQRIFASFHSHFLAVFDISAKQHVYTLLYKKGLLLLNAAAVCHHGHYLIQAVFNEQQSRTEVLLWDVGLSRIYKVLKNVSNVSAVALSEDATIAVIAMKRSLRVWRPLEVKTETRRHLTISCPLCVNITEDRQMSSEGIEILPPKLKIISARNHILLVWRGFYLWDLNSGQLLGSFSLFDVPLLSFTLCHNDTFIVYSIKNSSQLCALSLTNTTSAETHPEHSVI